MIKRTSSLASIGFLLIIVVAFAGLLYLNIKISSLEIGGDDFYFYWLGTRVLLIDGLSPYQEINLSDIQSSSIEDHPINIDEIDLIPTPLYASLITLPFSMIDDFTTANAFWMTALQVALSVLILMMLKITNWRPKIFVFGILVFSLFFSYLAIPVFVSGNMIIWTSLFLVLAIGALQARRDEIAGGILALTTIQPHIVALCIIFILIWTIYQKRYLVVVWFFGLIILMVILGIFFIPDWPIQYMRVFLDVINNLNHPSLRAVLIDKWPGIGNQLAWILIIVTIVILLAEWWLARLRQFRWFFWTLCLTLVLSRFISFPVFNLQNLILYIPLILILSVLRERWQKSGRLLNILILIIFFLGGWLFILNGTSSAVRSLMGDLLYLLPFIIFIMLYWIRWWAIRDPRYLMLELNSRGEY